MFCNVKEFQQINILIESQELMNNQQMKTWKGATPTRRLPWSVESLEKIEKTALYY